MRYGASSARTNSCSFKTETQSEVLESEVMMNVVEASYRKMATEGLSGLGLLIALYDTLAGDLRRAAEADRRNQIEKRCQEINHALLVLGHLEEWVERGSGGELSQQLTRFYGSLRRKMILAQAKRSAELLEEQMNEVLRLRAIWQKIQTRTPENVLPESRESDNRISVHQAAWRSNQAMSYSVSAPTQEGSYTSSWSA